MSKGAKKKKVTPLAGGVRPPMTIVDALIKSPSMSDPASPMKSLAGWKLSRRKPRHIPQVRAAIRGPTLVTGRSPRASRRSP